MFGSRSQHMVPHLETQIQSRAHNFQIGKCVDTGERGCVSFVSISQASDIKLRVK